MTNHLVWARAFAQRMIDYARARPSTDVFLHPLPYTVRGDEEREEVKRLLEAEFDHVSFVDGADVEQIAFARK